MHFKQFVTDEIIQLVADQTNLFSVQKAGQSVNTNVKEIEQVLSMYVHVHGFRTDAQCKSILGKGNKVPQSC